MGRIKDFYNEHEELTVVLIIIIGIFLFLWGTTYGIYKYQVTVAEANIVKVYTQAYISTDLGIWQTEKVIYEGKKAFIKIESGGMTTTVTIYKKLYPIPVIDKIYSDKTIRVEGV